MRKLKAAAVVITLLVGLGVVGAAGAAAKIPPRQVTAHVKPHFVKKPPYRFTVSGRIVPPKLTCPSGQSTGYCVPCPPGKTASYCVPPPGQVCAGKVRISIRLGLNPNLAVSGRTIQKLFTRVRSDCTYHRTFKIAKSALTSEVPLFKRSKHKTVKLFFPVKFNGNTVLSAKKAKPTPKAKARLLSPL